jgi:hypothetical protein
MTVTLTKQITLKNAEIYLKLEKKVKREDIQMYLQGKHFDNPIVENRVRDYLKEIRVFDEQYHRTPYGNEVKETGMVDVLEEGKYLIWITQKDTLFGNKIFFLKRQPPNKSDNRFSEIDIDEKKHFCLSSNKKDFFFFNLKNTNITKYNGIKLQNDALLTLSWKWKDLASSVYTFEGKIGNNGIDKNIEIDSDEDLNKKIIEILPNWDSENNRCRMPIEAIRNIKDCPSSFQCNYRNKWEDFDVIVNNLPVEPYNFEEAKEWRKAIFNKDLEENYMHPDDFMGKIISINQKEGFTAYSDQLDIDIPEINQYISDLDRSAQKSTRGARFWHLAAPMDLNVGLPQQSKVDSFSLIKDESICFRDLAQKFGRITADKIFYYDKYVTNYYQQRSAAAFLNSLGIPDICIITDKTQQGFSNYLAQNKPAIVVEDIGYVYQQNRRDAPHDRFIIFKHGGDITVWTSTNSIDYIRFNVKGEIQPNDSGTILQSVTFTRVKKNILGPQLENFILGR